MPIRHDPALAGRTGIALYHAARSNCSARVRLLLEEKGLEWESRPISLQLKENRTEAYFAINPKGLVPSLIIDDLVITESNDILCDLEERFPAPAFMPSDPPGQERTRSWMRLSADIHLPGIKTLNYAMNPPKAPATQEQIARYAAVQKDPELIAFHQKVSGGGFTLDDRSRAAGLLGDALKAMDVALGEGSWLASGAYGLADICWAPTLPTLQGSGFDLTPFPNLLAWHGVIAARPAYRKAVTDWRNTAISTAS